MVLQKKNVMCFRILLIHKFHNENGFTSLTNKKGFLFIGRLNRQKGIDVIVKAAEKCPDASFMLIGSIDSLFVEKASFPPNVRWLGVLDNDEKNNMIQTSTALVFASRSYEGFPMVFLEAMQHCMPIIAPRLAGYPEIIHEGENGWLFTPEDDDDLARTINSVMDNPELSVIYGHNGREHLRNKYCRDVWYKEYMNVVSSLLKVKI